jgi:hypothetical protein
VESLTVIVCKKPLLFESCSTLHFGIPTWRHRAIIRPPVEEKELGMRLFVPEMVAFFVNNIFKTSKDC